MLPFQVREFERTKPFALPINSRRAAGLAELVDAPDSKSGDSDIVGVRFPLPAPRAMMNAERRVQSDKHSAF